MEGSEITQESRVLCRTFCFRHGVVNGARLLLQVWHGINPYINLEVEVVIQASHKSLESIPVDLLVCATGVTDHANNPSIEFRIEYTKVVMEQT